MTAYWILLLLTALIAYLFGSLRSVVIASNFVFHRSLLRLGKGNVWLSNFRRIYGLGGFIRLGLVELVKDLLPILIGGSPCPAVPLPASVWCWAGSTLSSTASKAATRCCPW